MSLINSDVVPFTGGAYEIEQSLRFNDGDTAYLSWTPSSAGNRKTYTFSAWVKRGDMSSDKTIWGGSIAGSWLQLRISTNGTLLFAEYTSSTYYINLISNQVFRDPTAWYHFVVAVDTTQATSSNRIKLYVNGEQITSFSTETYPSQNYDTYINRTEVHYFGRINSVNWFDGYIAEAYFIDGQQLDPTSFGETGTYGEWKPIEYTGTYGTNGFYLPFKQDYTVEGMSAVTWIGTSGSNGDGITQYIGGVGFQPDLIWIKGRNQARDHVLHDTVRGLTKGFHSNRTDAEYTNANVVEGVSADGFIAGDFNNSNYTGWTYVAWCWDMGGSTVSNTNGSITSSVRANTTYGQSIVSYTGNGTAGATIGHGLSSAPEMVIVKGRDNANHWTVYHESMGGGQYFIDLNQTNQVNTATSVWNDTNTTSSVFSIGTNSRVNTSSYGYIAYCFHSVSGYSKFGSYTGNSSSTGPIVTTGFEPAFLIIKRTDSAGSWFMYDNVRKATNPRDLRILADTSDAEWDSNGGVDVDFLSTGFQLKTSDGAVNSSSGTYIYMAFADTREFAYWLDQSGNNNDWTSNNLTESDISVDSPTNNFATWNVLDPRGNANTFSEGNLKVVGNYQSTNDSQGATFGVSSGKWYWETYIESATSDGGYHYVGIKDTSGYDVNYWIARGIGEKTHNGTDTVDANLSWDVGDIVGCALDMDAGNWYIYVNGTVIDSGNAVYSSINVEVTPTQASASGSNTQTTVANFGQDSSFAGNKTAQGNTDSNGIGDFYYTPPSGYLALCTANLPDPAVIPSEHFNTVLYTGDGTDGREITGVGFQPDVTWAKSRTSSEDHIIVDVVRGYEYDIRPNTTAAESTYSGRIQSSLSDGFQIGSGGIVNSSGNNYVAWNWKTDNASGSSNTDGSITSTVSVNQDAGISIVKWADASYSDTIGHGLTQAPDFIVAKETSIVRGWLAYHSALGSSYYMGLNSTSAAATPNAGRLEVSGSNTFICGNDGSSVSYQIAYCFHSVDGFSKAGSYTGNGSSDGPFVYTGFRPAWIMTKSVDRNEHWRVRDTARDTNNPLNVHLEASGSGADQTSVSVDIDILSNGFKILSSDSGVNASGEQWVYIAFAENPFKYTNAR